VRRTDARLWLSLDGQVTSGLAASYAAGVIRSDGATATLEAVAVRRGLFARSGAPTLDGGPAAVYEPFPVPDPTPDSLNVAIQNQLGMLERHVAEDAGAAELVVLDGRLSAHGHRIPGAVGFVKTHHRRYLDDDLDQVVAALGDGQRTPLFLTQTHHSRYSWYLRLPAPDAGVDRHPWTGIVRCEISPEMSVNDATRMADLASSTLPKFASRRHRDSRAPQNLVPIGALEDRLRHRLGDPAVLERRLRQAASETSDTA
jgi:uncharacterized protein